MITVCRWTGREAKPLRPPLRLSVRDVAARLGVGIRTIDHGKPDRRAARNCPLCNACWRQAR